MRRFIALLIIIAIAVGIGYYVYTNGWKLPSIGSMTSDAAATARVKAALALSQRVSPFDISVTTQGGTATLAGQVPSESVKSLAGEIARDVKGVKEVKNELTVDPGAQPSSESVRVEDLEIRAAILEAFTRSPELGGRSIDVKVENRMVTLSGAVETAVQRSGAEQTARATQGVVGVANNITVNNPQAATEPPAGNKIAADPNAELAKKVEFELYRTGAFDTRTMTIQASSGAVTLSGSVRSRAEQLLAERVAQVVDGVKTVTNNLQVASAPAGR